MLVAIRDELLGTVTRFLQTGSVDWTPYNPDADGNTRQFGGAPFVTEPAADLLREAWPLWA
jgi:hypothetical protein